VHVNAGVTRLAQQGAELRATLSSGADIAADLVICAAGVRPAIDFLGGSGMEIGRGIRVDARMRTNLPDVYAAGDVT
jgi:NAD(P)H-nitrite reductase large subunit